jgi:hypothetical protein
MCLRCSTQKRRYFTTKDIPKGWTEIVLGGSVLGGTTVKYDFRPAMTWLVMSSIGISGTESVLGASELLEKDISGTVKTSQNGRTHIMK